MENTDNHEEGAANARKVTLGIRISPEHKHRLSLEATELGISLSERSENLLLCAESEIAKKNQETAKVQRLEKDLMDLKELHLKTLEEFENKITLLEAEKVRLSQVRVLQDNKEAIFSEKSEKRLLHFFKKLEGQKDIIETEDGERMEITYNSQADVLISMLYSFRLKKP